MGDAPPEQRVSHRVREGTGQADTIRGQIEAKPLYETLQVVQDGRSVFVEDPIVSGALRWGTVLSIPYAIDELVPLLAEAYA